MNSPISAADREPSRWLADLFGLAGKTAVVVGGTGVLGGSFCVALARAGAYVYVVGRDSCAGTDVVDSIAALGGAAECVVVDATDRGQLVQLLSRIEAAGRRVDILINAAGINSPTPFLEIPDDEWERIFNVNLNSVRLACQVFGRAMLAAGLVGAAGAGGAIINITSVSSELPLSRVFTYSASKAAVLNLTRNLAREWAPYGVRVNALSPGFFPAEQNRKVLTPDRIASIMTHTPMGRFGRPEELAGAVLLLASPVAGSFITGTHLYVDGGFTAMTI